MAKQMTDSTTPSHEQIARRAYEIFIERGQPEGRDLEHWLEAESQLRAASQSQSNRAPQPVASTQTSATPTRSSSSVTSAPPSNGRSSARTPSRATARK